MSETLQIAPADAKKKTAQDALGTTIGTWDDLQVYLISSSRMMKEVVSASTISESFRKIEEGVDAVVPVDAQNAPTSDFENYKERSFQQRLSAAVDKRWYAQPDVMRSRLGERAAGVW